MELSARLNQNRSLFRKTLERAVAIEISSTAVAIEIQGARAKVRHNHQIFRPFLNSNVKLSHSKVLKVLNAPNLWAQNLGSSFYAQDFEPNLRPTLPLFRTF